MSRDRLLLPESNGNFIIEEYYRNNGAVVLAEEGVFARCERQDMRGESMPRSRCIRVSEIASRYYHEIRGISLFFFFLRITCGFDEACGLAVFARKSRCFASSLTIESNQVYFCEKANVHKNQRVRNWTAAVNV